MPGPEEATGPPILLYLLAGIFALLACWTLRGLNAGWQATIGKGLEWLASVLDFKIPTGLHTFHLEIGHFFSDVDHAVQSWLGSEADKLDTLSGRWFHEAGHLVEWTALEIQNTTNDVLGWGKWLLHVRLPKWAKWISYVAFPWVLVGKYVRNLIRYAIAHMARVTRVIVHEGGVVAGRLPRTLERRLSKDENWLKWLALAVGGVLGGLYLPHPHKLPSMGGVWRGLTKRLARIERRLKRLEGLLGAAGMAAAMANALGLPNWRCITRGNLGRVSRAICGLSSAALQDLLGLIADVLLLEYLCDAITLMEDGFALIEPELSAFIDGAAAMFIHCGYEFPPTRNPPQLYVPDTAFTQLYVPA